MIAIPWLVLSTTGSATHTGLVAVAEITPLVLFKALGGPLVDRLGTTAGGAGVRPALGPPGRLIPLLHGLGILTFPTLLVWSPSPVPCGAPATRPPPRWSRPSSNARTCPYERATGLASAIERGATMDGRPIAGGLVAVIGAANAVAPSTRCPSRCAPSCCFATTRSLRDPVPTPEAVVEGAAPDSSYVDELRAWLDLPARVTSVLIEPVPDGRGHQPARPRLVGRAAARLGARLRCGCGRWSGLVFSVWGGASMLGSVVAAAYGHPSPEVPDLPGRLPDHRAPEVRPICDRCRPCGRSWRCAGSSAVRLVRLPQPRDRRRRVFERIPRAMVGPGDRAG